MLPASPIINNSVMIVPPDSENFPLAFHVKGFIGRRIADEQSPCASQTRTLRQAFDK